MTRRTYASNHHPALVQVQVYHQYDLVLVVRAASVSMFERADMY